MDSWPYSNIRRRVTYHLTSLESGLELARRGMCAIFLPFFVAGLHNATVLPSLRLRRLANPRGMGQVRQTVHIVTRNERRDEAAIQHFGRAMMQALWTGSRLSLS